MSLFELSLSMAIILLCACMMIILVRFVRGPHLVDRIIASDLLAANLIVAIAVYSVLTVTPAFLDVAIVISLIAFLGTMSFAYFLIKRKK